MPETRYFYSVRAALFGVGGEGGRGGRLNTLSLPDNVAATKPE